MRSFNTSSRLTPRKYKSSYACNKSLVMHVTKKLSKNGRIREDGRMVHDLYVYEVKNPSESKGE